MKKLINRPGSVVPEMIEGLVAIWPGLRKLPGHEVVVRAGLDAGAARPREVAVISGGGSGHEPAHAGYVGEGMLSAAVAGDVFTSPDPDSVLAAIQAVAGPAGAVLVVKNYTGDRLNFGLAAEMARAGGIPVEVVLVADDVALRGSTGQTAGPRGLAGAVLVHKVAGAASAAGLSLLEVAAEARDAASNLATMGVALSPCTVPAAGAPGFDLGPDEVELGLGIHGEPGVERRCIGPADDIVDLLLAPIVAELALKPGDRIALLVNNLGATPTMELAIVARHAISSLEATGLTIERVYAGTFLTALEMAGVSLTVLKLDDARLARLDATTDAPAWPNQAALNRPRGHRDATPDPTPETAPAKANPPTTPVGLALERAIRAAANSLIKDAPRLTELDRAVGDGDLGISLARGANAVLEAMPTYPLDDPAATLHALSVTLQRSLGGTSGPLYAVLALRAAARLKSATQDPKNIPLRTWSEAFEAGVEAIADLGGAAPGDRTMLDALHPASQAFSDAIAAGNSAQTAQKAAADAAQSGANSTATMPPRKGRSSYLGDRALGHPDPGAIAVATWMRAIAGIS
ncbi:dihydroxyacetone kinase subunit DhaL [Isosphaeraceae bacterium EP7]